MLTDGQQVHHVDAACTRQVIITIKPAHIPLNRLQNSEEWQPSISIYNNAVTTQQNLM